MDVTYFQNVSSDNLTSNIKRLVALLESDLDFHDEASNGITHDIHSFPAKFPPQLPRKFIFGLTQENDVVLDPMMGSGTTMLEAYLTGRRGLGFDIDPLARLVAQVKVTPLDTNKLEALNQQITHQATETLERHKDDLKRQLAQNLDKETRKFVDFWFASETQIELLALVNEIKKISDPELQAFFKVVFSSVIITKSGGVSMAFDLGHTRPHRAKVVVTGEGEILLGEELAKNPSDRVQLLTKTLRSPLKEWSLRFKRNLDSIKDIKTDGAPVILSEGDAQDLPLDTASIDLIVTSPPYASNAIDYMRAHKFTLVWFGYPIRDLGQLRGEYIGGESTVNFDFITLPPYTKGVVEDVTGRDEKKGRVLHRYYSEMYHTLQEMYRVLKPGKSAIVVVGSSIMRERDTETEQCLAEIGQTLGFMVPAIGVRNLDRNRRMLPVGEVADRESQIQKRMHQEYVIGFVKPV